MGKFRPEGVYRQGRETLVIIMDLEWNYSAAKGEPQLQNKTIQFEIIQIGAAMVDGEGEIQKTFDQLIAPTVHRTMMPKVSELTGITDQKLIGQPNFQTVWKEFSEWMGEEKEILFWGNCDRAVLLSNLLFFGFPGGDDLILYDLQALFDKAFLKSNQQTALSSALSALRLTPYGQYHSALSDAVNAAFIFKTLGGEAFLRKNQHKLKLQRKKKKDPSEDGDLILERVFQNVTDFRQVRPRIERELASQFKGEVKEILHGFYRNHKKIWAYQSDDCLIKVTSRSRPSLSGEGKDFVVRFFQIERAQLELLRQCSRKQGDNPVRRRKRNRGHF